jgi:tetratricopeptide (TPR) repeat protein
MDAFIGTYDSRAAVTHFRRAFNIDSTFYTTLLYASLAYINMAEMSRADTLSHLLVDHLDQLSEYDRHWALWLRAFLDQDQETAIREIRAAAQIAPQSRATYILSYLLELKHCPNEVIRVLATVDPNRGGMRGNHLYWQRRINAHIILGEHELALDEAQEARIQYPGFGSVFSYYVVLALINLDRIEEARPLWAEIDHERPNSDVFIGWHLEQRGFDAVALEVYRETADWLRSLPPNERGQAENRYHLAHALYSAEEYADALAIADDLCAEFPGVVNHVGLRGVTLARLGDRDGALALNEQLATMDRRAFMDEAAVWRARILTVLGEREAAVRVLEDAYRQSYLNFAAIASAPDLTPLRDHPDFQELMRPKG